MFHVFRCCAIKCWSFLPRYTPITKLQRSPVLRQCHILLVFLARHLGTVRCEWLASSMHLMIVHHLFSCQLFCSFWFVIWFFGYTAVWCARIPFLLSNDWYSKNVHFTTLTSSLWVYNGPLFTKKRQSQASRATIFFRCKSGLMYFYCYKSVGCSACFCEYWRVAGFSLRFLN